MYQYAAPKDLKAYSYHGNDWARDDVGNQVLKEGLAAEILVVLLRQLFAGDKHLQALECEALTLKAGYDFAYQPPLYTIGLDLQSQ